MNDDLLVVLKELENSGVEYCSNQSFTTSNPRISMCYLSYKSKINIYIEDSNNRTTLLRFMIYKNKIIYFKYYGISGIICDHKEITEVRAGISSEEEYFQESTLINLLDLDFEKYEILSKILITISDKLEDE